MLLTLEFNVGPLNGQTIYDLGCGTGTVSTIMAEGYGVRVTGVDLDPILIARAKCNSPHSSFLTANLKRLSEANPRFAHTKVDEIWAPFVAAYFPTQEGLPRVIELWASLLKPGSWLCLVDINGLFYNHQLLLCSRKFFKYIDRALPSHDAFVSAGLERAVEYAGLCILAGHVRIGDRGLAFDGPASPLCLEAWSMRLARPGSHRAFLKAASGDLETAEHAKTVSPPPLPPKQQSSIAKQDNHGRCPEAIVILGINQDLMLGSVPDSFTSRLFYAFKFSTSFIYSA